MFLDARRAPGRRLWPRCTPCPTVLCTANIARPAVLGHEAAGVVQPFAQINDGFAAMLHPDTVRIVLAVPA
jgi:hypothetical protein